MDIRGPVWIESRPSSGSFAGETIYIQWVSFDDTLAEYDSPQHIADIMNVMMVKADQDLLIEGDPNVIFPTFKYTYVKNEE